MEEVPVPTLEELLKKHNIKTEASPLAGPRAKLLAQADRMLNELAKYKTEAELNGESSQYWWAPQSVNGQRRVVMRYGNKVVAGVTVYADNTLAAVTQTIKDFKAVIVDSDDATWADEEARRAKK
jgi:hypothetical protein